MMLSVHYKRSEMHFRYMIKIREHFNRMHTARLLTREVVLSGGAVQAGGAVGEVVQSITGGDIITTPAL